MTKDFQGLVVKELMILDHWFNWLLGFSDF